MNEVIDVYDPTGKKIQIPRAEYARQVMEYAKQDWNSLERLRAILPQLLQVGLAQEANEVANQAATLSGGHVQDAYWRAVTLSLLNKLDEAAKEFEDLIEDAAYPEDQARAAVGLAQVRSRQGRTSDAEKMLDFAIETDPTNPGPLMALHAYWGERRTPAKAVERIKAMAEAEPDNPTPHRALAHLASQAGQKEEVRQHVAAVIERSGDDAPEEVLIEQTFLLGRAGCAQDVIDLLEDRQDQIRNFPLLMNLVQAYMDLGQKEKARALLQRLSAGAPPEVRGSLQARLRELSK